MVLVAQVLTQCVDGLQGSAFSALHLISEHVKRSCL